jgi:hypothetical protein
MKKTILLVLLVLALGLLPVAGQATTYITNNQADFLSRLSAYYTENFTGADGNVDSPLLISGGGYSYSLSNEQGLSGSLYRISNALSVITSYDGILGGSFASSGDPIRAIGGLFYGTDDAGGLFPGSVFVTVNTVLTEVISTSAPQFFGIILDDPITSLKVVSDQTATAMFPTIDNLTVGSPSPVPVPPAVLLMGSGLLGLIGFRKKFVR